jgi:TolB-like protein
MRTSIVISGRVNGSERNQSFHPRIAAIVRVQTRRIRNRLIRYYRTLGIDDPIEIELPAETFLPLIRWRGSGGLHEPTVAEDSKSAVGFRCFRTLTSNPDDQLFCENLTKQVFNAMQGEASVHLEEVPADQDMTFVDMYDRPKLKAVLEGKVRRAGGRIRISVKLTNAVDGALILSEMFDCDDESQTFAPEELGSAIARAVARCTNVSGSSPLAPQAA